MVYTHLIKGVRDEANVSRVSGYVFSRYRDRIPPPSTPFNVSEYPFLLHHRQLSSEAYVLTRTVYVIQNK